MSDGAGKGPRARPLDTTSSLHRSTAGGLSARAAGLKGFGMLGHVGSHGRSMVARVRSLLCRRAAPCAEPYPAATISRYCFHDDFARTVSGGAGEGPCGLWESVVGDDEPGYPPDDMYVTEDGLFYLSGYNEGRIISPPLSSTHCIVVAVSLATVAPDYTWDHATMGAYLEIGDPDEQAGTLSIQPGPDSWKIAAYAEGTTSSYSGRDSLWEQVVNLTDFHPDDFFVRFSVGTDGVRARVWDQADDEPAEWTVTSLPPYPWVTEKRTLGMRFGYGWWAPGLQPEGAPDYPAIAWRVTGLAVCCGPLCCSDDFSRTVATGWGTAPDWESGWAAPSPYSDTPFSVSGSMGVVDVKAAVREERVQAARCSADWPTGDYAEVWGRFRRQGTREGTTDDGLDMVVLFSPGSSYTWGADSVGFQVNWAEIAGTSYYVNGVDDNRDDPPGGAPQHSEAYTWPALVGWWGPWDWWHFRLRVDRWGVYLQLWADGQEKDGNPASSQPWDESLGNFGSGWSNPNRESWTAWDAWDTPRSEMVSPLRVFVSCKTVTWNNDSTVEFDYIRLAPCTGDPSQCGQGYIGGPGCR